MRRSLFADILVLALANALWGSTDTVAKLALSDMSPVALMWTRFTIAFAAFIPVLIIRRGEIILSIRGFLPFLGLGLCGFFLNYVFLYRGLELSLASHATALRVFETLVIVLLSAIFLGERVGKRALAGLVAGTAGVILVLDVNFADLHLFGSGSRLGDILIITGIIIEGFYTIIGKRVLVKTSPLTATALACVFGWIMLTAVYGADVAGEFSKKLPPIGAFLACAYLGLMATVLAYWMYYRILSVRSSHRVGISIMLQPVVGIPLAAIVFHDELTAGFLAGAVLIAAGVYLALGSGSKRVAKAKFVAY